MPRPGDRRPRIADAAISVLAQGGARTLTHQSVDRAAGIALGSTSYYFRTRRDLVVAVIQRVRVHSRAASDDANPPDAVTIDGAAALIDDQLRRLATERRDQALSVFALLPEVEDDGELRGELARCLFSRDLAADLLTALGAADPVRDALDFNDFLTGLLFGLLFGQRRDTESPEDGLAQAIARFLRSCQSPAIGGVSG
ncbi:TetR/AcrR family transcriptional regulator [Jongsikchunia kroppenstedtii]|uniref:TetR/AcrR family transcriptional regulator n=1 Tax=Jongsikchunia kroppenstedtii TaxID=1121721 RepID=UPI00047578F1|nr:TetR family transcriptional regulator [Jongsikchunia kroppenstedtii]